jgi:hypothetical protein
VADNNEPTLRNALDAVNTSRKWALLGIGSMCFAVVLLLFILFMMVIPSLQPPGVAVDAPADTPTVAINRGVPLKVLWVATAIQLLFVACATGVLMLHVSRMTRAVLRAIESTRQ